MPVCFDQEAGASSARFLVLPYPQQRPGLGFSKA